MPDYAAIAKKFGGTSQTEQLQNNVDYSALAKEYGGEAAPARSWGDVAGSAVGNLPSSIGQMIGGIYETVRHPIDTATNIGKMVIGAGEAGAEKLAGMVDPELVAFNKQINTPSESQRMAQNVGQYYAQKYGTEEGFKKALAEDPAGILADAATVLTAGGGAAAKIPALQKVGAGISRAGATIDPLAITARGVGAAARITGKGLQAGLGMTTGAGAESIKEAFKAGKTGGESAKQFTENLRGQVPKTDVLNEIDANIQSMGRERSQSYQEAMSQLGKYEEPVAFDKIKQAADEAMGIQTFTGPKSGLKVSTARSTLDMQKKIGDLISEWDGYPDDFKTPAGLDALKKNIKDLRDSSQFGTPERLVADKVYHAVKDTIVKEAPEYSSAMKNYQDASDLIDEIRSTLSQKPNASIDTQMRKLQSLMRNNVNTSYGNRLDLVREMEQQGGRQVVPAVAGQSLSTWTPRGIQSASTIPTALLAGGVGGLGLGAATLGAAMPRVVGEATYYAGKGAGTAERGVETVNRLAELLNVNPRIAANLMYQAQQPKR